MNLLINQVKEGAVIEPHHNDILNHYIKDHFSGTNMVYVSNRVKSYSVNPLIYPETEKTLNLVTIAMTPRPESMRKSTEYESQFYDKPYEIFDSLNKAIEWVHKILKKAENLKPPTKPIKQINYHYFKKNMLENKIFFK